MEALVETVKNIGYVIIIFTILDKTTMIDKNNGIIRYVAGLLVVLTIITPIFSAINNWDLDGMQVNIDAIIDYSNECSIEERVDNNNQLALDYISNIEDDSEDGSSKENDI